MNETDLDLKIEGVLGGLRNYGYCILCKPNPGHEQEYYEHLRDGLRRADDTLDMLRSKFKYRGTSKAALRSLHKWLPEPCWGVLAR